MARFTRAAGALAAVLAIGVSSAGGADLDYDRYPGGKRYSGYDEPAPIPYRSGTRIYTTEPVTVVPPAYVYRERARDLDDDDGRGPRAHIPSDRRAYYRDDDPRYRAVCVPRDEIKRRLLDEGWRDFTDFELRGGVARVEARRRGDIYVLKVDRCSGDIVDARRLGRSLDRSFAYDEPDRPRRPYY